MQAHDVIEHSDRKPASIWGKGILPRNSNRLFRIAMLAVCLPFLSACELALQLLFADEGDYSSQMLVFKNGELLEQASMANNNLENSFAPGDLVTITTLTYPGERLMLMRRCPGGLKNTTCEFRVPEESVLERFQSRRLAIEALFGRSQPTDLSGIYQNFTVALANNDYQGSGLIAGNFWFFSGRSMDNPNEVIDIVLSNTGDIDGNGNFTDHVGTVRIFDQSGAIVENQSIQFLNGAFDPMAFSANIQTSAGEQAIFSASRDVNAGVGLPAWAYSGNFITAESTGGFGASPGMAAGVYDTQQLDEEGRLTLNASSDPSLQCTIPLMSDEVTRGYRIFGAEGFADACPEAFPQKVLFAVKSIEENAPVNAEILGLPFDPAQQQRPFRIGVRFSFN